MMAKQGKAAKPAAPEAKPQPRSPLARRGRGLLGAVLGVAFLLRVWALDTMPIAGDESGYLRWAEIIVNQGQWFISLLDGKQPLTCWLHALALWAWRDDPLVAARGMSALAGTASALGIFAIGRRLADQTAGLVAAALYAFLPYALLYDRLTYTEAYVNLAGVAIVYTSLACFQDRSGSWKPAVWMGLALGLGFFSKSTALLFWFFPVVAALWLRGPRDVPRLAAAYAVAALFPLFSWAAVPRAPMMATHSLVVHQTSFFVPLTELVRNPLAVAPQNLRLMGEYLAAYVTVPLALAAVAALGYLTWRRSTAAWVVVSASLAPLLVQIFVLQKMFPTRYPFPHVWPWLVVAGMAAAALPRPGASFPGGAVPLDRSRPPGRLAAALPRRGASWAAALLAVPMVVRGVGVVRTPGEHLYAEDAASFLGSGPAAGHGIREAAAFLLGEARQASAPLTVLTDPIWGPPADSMFIYLNGRAGIRVHEAWWTTISGEYPILPPAPVELVKSQYERVAAGMLDPRELGPVYYVTETHYYSPAAVRVRQPTARLVASFRKPNGRNSVDVYRLK